MRRPTPLRSFPSPAAFDALTSTTSPGAVRPATMSSAASASATMMASPPHEPSMTAPWCMALIDLPVPTTMSRLTSNRTASRPMRSCSDIASSPSSAISPSTAQLRRVSAALAGHPGQRLQAGQHGVRVGVVGVVDDRDAVVAGGDVHAVLRAPGPRRPARPPPVRRLAPHSSATAAAHSALDTWWSPCTASDTSASTPAACSVKRGRATSSSVDRARPHVGAGRPRHPDHPGGGLFRHRRDGIVVGVEDDHARRRNSLRQFGFGGGRWPRGSRTRRGGRSRR